ncbi:phage tail protein [Vibrio alginolyticus]|nr:phage tail protein [Vibrio alginolyticus]EGR2553707.1 phage tail protein [Vibrio alginolyticus]EIL2910657.1 phage tail protein [Vibrio alginolyticus]EJV5949523.1 phage tail protein [Vibrio alginolyticus]EKP4442006.1 phage tail protein [Vibrio alginolyticus]
MPKKFEAEKRDNGSFASLGLNEKQFNQLFNKIEQAQKKNRRNAKRTLTAATLTKPTNKALKALGEKAKGQRFTKEDLIKFDKARQRHKEVYDSKTAGITYAFLVKNSRQIDVDRANNRVHDGTGIHKATMFGIKNNIALIRVRASRISKHEEHRVKVRFEQWDELLHEPPNGDYNQAVQLACAGRISFDCDCGRHQYWYRYLATMGNYCIAPPKEFTFPKIRNPELSGVACKHVLKSVTMLQSLAWQRILANQMKQQARRVGFGSDNKTYLLNKNEKTAAARNRKTVVDKAAATREHAKYLRAQKAVEKQIAKQKRESETIKRQARKLRKESNEKKGYIDMIKVGFQNFHDGYKLQGKTKSEALTDFAKLMNVTPRKLERIIK